MRALKALNPYIWKHKKLLFLGILFVIISNLFGVYPPQVVRGAVDYVAELMKGGDLAGKEGEIAKTLLLYGLLVIGLALARGFFLFLTRQTLIVMSREVEYDLRNDLYDHYQKLSLSFYRRNKTGDLMARISEDVSRVRMYLGPGIMYTINTITLMIIVITTMLTVNPTLTLYTILPLPILSVMIYFVESVVQKRSDRIQKQLSKLTSFAQEIFSGIRVVKAYTREKETLDTWREESEEYKKRSMSLVQFNAMFHPVVMLLVGLATVLTVWIGGIKVIDGEITLGMIAEFILYVNMLTWPIVAIGWVTTLIQRAGASQIRLNELLGQRSEIEFPEQGPKVRSASISFEDVSFKYQDTGIQALDGVTFELEAGKKLGILGPTGSGKTTLCNVLPRMFDIDDGVIRIDGQDIRSYTVDELRKSIGYAPQDAFLFSETIKENVAFGKPGTNDEEVMEAMRNAGMSNDLETFAEGLQTMVGERGVTLSGGQKQRLAMARAWVRKPKILILDDSLSAVDTKTEEFVLQRLRQARQEDPDMSVIMISHRISTLQDSDLIIVLEDGKVTEQGTHAELINNGGYYAEINRRQLLESQMEETD